MLILFKSRCCVGTHVDSSAYMQMMFSLMYPVLISTDVETLDRHWRSYEVFPMGCNVQLVYYRPLDGGNGDVLVKVLLNEQEATLPIATDCAPYYHWADFRRYCLDKLSVLDNRQAAKD